ncbi:hypothetical protein GCM10022295_03800 [Streptomyces osmaniensis]|uniref:Uncharacterized protein n=1 Tax=Streptomyces osmaniensis TaxID=593134 RepID=A0ABP6V157_9ACTN
MPVRIPGQAPWASAAGWFERVGDAVVADHGEWTRIGVVYGARGSDANAVVYDDELTGERYCVDRCRQTKPAENF